MRTKASQEFSGLDRHTILADVLYRDTAGRDFVLAPGSVNRSAGAGSATIGANPGATVNSGGR